MLNPEHSYLLAPPPAFSAGNSGATVSSLPSRSQWPAHVKIFGTQRQPRARDFWGLVNFQVRSWATHAQFLLAHSPVILSEGTEGSPAYDIIKLLPHEKGASQEALVVKNPSVNAGDMGSIPGSGRSPEEGHSNPLQYSCLENPIDRGAWRAAVHSVPKSWI